jgi:hypothetical protein
MDPKTVRKLEKALEKPMAVAPGLKTAAISGWLWAVVRAW